MRKKTTAGPTFMVLSWLRFAAREVSQRGGGARRGSGSARGTRLAVEPVSGRAAGRCARKAQVPRKRERRLPDEAESPGPAGAGNPVKGVPKRAAGRGPRAVGGPVNQKRAALQMVGGHRSP